MSADSSGYDTVAEVMGIMFLLTVFGLAIYLCWPKRSLTDNKEKLLANNNDASAFAAVEQKACAATRRGYPGP